MWMTLNMKLGEDLVRAGICVHCVEGEREKDSYVGV